jgi:hypothetical protein
MIDVKQLYGELNEGLIWQRSRQSTVHKTTTVRTLTYFVCRNARLSLVLAYSYSYSSS